jgi:hypothetical protein
MKNILTQEELEELLVYWQKVLRLNNYDIKVVITRNEDMPLEYCDAVVITHISEEESTIFILDSVDNVDIEHIDMEEALVHELVHINFDRLDYFLTDTDEVKFEQIVDRIAKALVEIKRS